MNVARGTAWKRGGVQGTEPSSIDSSTDLCLTDGRYGEDIVPPPPRFYQTLPGYPINGFIPTIGKE